MAKNRFVRMLSIAWDRDAARRLQSEAENALDKTGTAAAAEFEGAMKVGGQKGARALTSSLQREYKLRMARASQQLAEGAINERAFRREGEKAAREFNAGLSAGIKRLQASGGGLTDAQFVGLGSRFKTTGGAGGIAGMAAGLRGLAGPLAGYLTATEGLRQIRTATEAADELEKSIRRLGGTSKITGVDLQFLTDTAKAVKEEFKLATPIANDLTGFMTQLAARSGDASRAQKTLASWLDLAGARGLTAAEAMQALEVTIRGQDEGLNRLGLQNPKEIYDRWGAGADEASKAAAILNEVVTEGAKVQGEWARSMETTGGKADQAAQKIRDLQAEFGAAIGPTRRFFNEVKLVVFEAIIRLATLAAKAVGALVENFQRVQLGLPFGAPLPGSTAPDPTATGVLTPNPSGTKQLSPEEKEAAQKRIGALWVELQNWINNHPLKILGTTPEQDELIAEQLARRARASEFLRRGGNLTPVQTGQSAGEGGLFPGITAVGEDELSRFEKIVMGAFVNIDRVSSDVAGGVTAAWQDAFSLMMEEGKGVGDFFEGLGRGIAGSLGSALASFASGKAKENFAAAIESAAYALGFSSHGNFASASAAWASAAEHTAAGIAWSAVSGGAAAGGGALRSRGPGSTYDQGLSSTRDTFASGGIQSEVNIYINPWDPSNQGMQRGVKQAVDFATERYADRKINIRPYPGVPK